VRTSVEGVLQILEQEEDENRHDDGAHKFQSVCGHTKLYVRFAPTSLCKPDAKVLTGESPSGYLGNLDMDYTHQR
jgi:hypothetical protein